jgi:hypothetical protein
MTKTKLRYAGAAAVSGALLVPLTVFGGTGFAKSASSAQYQYRITICHHTHSQKHPTVTIGVSSSAWKAHQKHHDTMGACPPPPAAATAATAATLTSHGSDNTPAPNSHANSKATEAASNGKANGHNK